MIDTNAEPEEQKKQSSKPTPMDIVQLNDKFTSKQYRVALPIPELEEIYKKQKVV